MNPKCATRSFCACPNCRAFAFDTEGGEHRGSPITVRTEKQRALAGYAPTHRKASQ